MTKLELEQKVIDLEKENKELKAKIEDTTELRANYKALTERNKELVEETFTKQREINRLGEKEKDTLTNVRFLEQQLEGLTNLFNEIYLGLKDQNALLGVYSRNIAMFQEKIDLKVSKFNEIPEK